MTRLFPKTRVAAVVCLAAFNLTEVAAAESELSKPLPEDVDYRHVHEEVARAVFAQETEQALRWCREFLAGNPTEPEGLFFYAAALGQAGRGEEAKEAVRDAVEAGVPPERFLAGPEAGLAELWSVPGFLPLMAELGAESLVHGPMLGRLQPDSVDVWMRLAMPLPITVKAMSLDGSHSVEAGKKGGEEDDRTVVVRLAGLKPLTAYRYEVTVHGQSLGPYAGGRFRTPGPVGSSGVVRVAIGGCSAYKPSLERNWAIIAAHQPDAFLTLGDNVYIDAPRNQAYQRYKYYRRQSNPHYRNLMGQTAVYSIWDDHDFGKNDCAGGAAVEVPAWKREVWNVYRENWVNPGYGGGEEQPGCWYRFSLNDVEFFMTDGRYYRTDPDQTPPEERTMLGPVQKRWLLESLRESKATFKVIASGVPWAYGTKPGSLDPWDGFDKERQEIFDFLGEHGIEGVLLISADRHRHDVWRIERAGAYPLYEFESGRITNVHKHRMMEHALFSYNGRGFGLLEFDSSRPDPEVWYRVINEDGEVMHEQRVKRSELEGD